MERLTSIGLGDGVGVDGVGVVLLRGALGSRQGSEGGRAEGENGGVHGE